MSTKTGIEWTDATWNPIRGCSRVSEGCRNCYAEKVARRFSGPGQPFEGLVRIGEDGNAKAQWNGQVRFVEEHLMDPLRWKRPRRIFVNSVSDLFHENVTDEMRDRIFAVMALCPQHTFQVLTKRPERMRAYMSQVGKGGEIMLEASSLAFDIHSLAKYPRSMFPKNAEVVYYDLGADGDECGCKVHSSWPPPNVWLGTSVENQKAANERIPHLLETPAAVKFLSCEPLLGPINIRLILSCYRWIVREQPNPFKPPPDDYGKAISWVICGGESGAGARPMHPDWARSLRDQCVAAGVPFFFKQWGAWLPARMAGPCIDGVA